jgi:catechol 2,3-dioxygenase-like lactoylglutathione lyase family enzyme
MAEIVAPQGSPLAAAVISCQRLEISRAFYCDVIGFDAGPVEDWAGSAFEQFWGLTPGTRARTCLLTACGSPVGRVFLIEFAAPQRELIQVTPNSQVFGLANLNFYTADARAAVAELRALGYRFWTEPTQHSLNAGVGNPIEVIFDGPDGVAMNLVELATADPQTRIGQMRAYVERHGRTRRGYTPVVTTSHVARLLAAAQRFYEKVCGMGALFEDVMSADRVNAFLRLPEGGRTRIVFMQGNHMFGKIALSEPLNYAERCVDLRPRTHAPNIGYLAQVFEVRDVAASQRAAGELGAEIVRELHAGEVPGWGPCQQFLARNPGSGGLMWLLQRVS